MKSEPFSRMPDRAARVSLFLLSAAAIAVMLAAAGLSLLPHETVQTVLGRSAGDGRADTFTRGLFSGIVFRLRLFSLAALAAVLAGRLMRSRLPAVLHRVLCSAKPFFNDVRAAAAALLAESKAHLLCFFSVFLGGALLRLRFIQQPMGFDEAATFLRYAAKPLALGLTLYPEPNNHFFHTLLVHISTLVFGSAPFAIRLPACIAGVLAIPCFYCWARIAFGRQAALLTAGLTAASPVLVAYSVNARGYMLITLLFGTMLCLAAYIRQTDNAFAWLVLSLCGALGFYTVPVMVYPYAGVMLLIAVSLVRTGQRMRLLKKLAFSFAATACLTAVLYAPALVVSGPSAFLDNGLWHQKGPAWLASGLPRYVCTVWQYWSEGLPAFVVAALAAGALAAAGGSKKRLLSAGLFLTGICIALFFMRLPPVPAFSRVWLFAAPVYYALGASGMVQLLHAALRRAPLRMRELCFAALCMALTLSAAAGVVNDRNRRFEAETGSFRDAGQVAAFLQPRLRAGDRVICMCPSGEPLQYYFFRQRISPHWLQAGPEPCRRLFAVVNTAHGQTLADVLREARISREAFTAPRIAAVFATGSVYEMLRR